MKIQTKTKIKILTEHEIETICAHLSSIIYKRDANLIYKGHVPMVGHLLVDGEITFVKSSRPILKLKKGSVFGVKELIEGTPFPFNTQVSPETEVVILDRSTIQEILASGDKELQRILVDILSAKGNLRLVKAE